MVIAQSPPYLIQPTSSWLFDRLQLVHRRFTLLVLLLTGLVCSDGSSSSPWQCQFALGFGPNVSCFLSFFFCQWSKESFFFFLFFSLAKWKWIFFITNNYLIFNIAKEIRMPFLLKTCIIIVTYFMYWWICCNVISLFILLNRVGCHFPMRFVGKKSIFLYHNLHFYI